MIGLDQQPPGISRTPDVVGHADTGTDEHHHALGRQWMTRRTDDALTDLYRLGRVGPRTDDDEFIPAGARERVLSARDGGEAS